MLYVSYLKIKNPYKSPPTQKPPSPYLPDFCYCPQRGIAPRGDAEKDIIGFALHYFDKNEISFSIGLNYINQGYGTEVAKLLVDKLEVEGIKEANAYCAADNYAAIRVLDKCGFENMGLAADKKRLRFNLKI